MKFSRTRSGFSLLEMMLFLGIVSMMSFTLVSVFISTQDSRIRQQGIAALEQRGGQILQTLTRRIRRAETILTPRSPGTGGILTLQMAQNTENPTIFFNSGANLYIVEKDTISPVLNDRLQMLNLKFTNIANQSVLISFDLAVALELPDQTVYRRHFESAVTLFMQNRWFEGGCNPAPFNPATSCLPIQTCVNGIYLWNYCDVGVCARSDAINKQLRC
ncbi:MAG: hypothetical protein KBD00_04685 [Candidatus Peribacteraceae bacterium]|nr:hypothetical protein [Candidatus Peribacteraceae bacterium]